ncbi:hypothetical protein [Cupriavidus sp. CP313]
MTNLRIHRWHNEYSVPGSHPAPAVLGHELDRLAPQLAQALAEHLDTLGDGNSDDGVVLLPVLEIDCDLDTACPPGQIVRHWSRQLAQAFARALDDPAAGALRLPSRAAYHARFIGQLLRGHGWDSWLYHRFEGLRALPAAAAVRTLLAEDAATGRATLALLDDASWPSLFAMLGEREAVRILSHWREQEGEPTGAGPPEPALAAWLHTSPGSIAAPLLALWLLAQGRHGQGAGIGAACWLATLLSMPGAMPAAELSRMAAHGGPLPGIPQGRPAAPADPDWLLLLATTPQPVREAVATLSAQARQAKRDGARDAPEQEPDLLEAPFGGLAWLLPALHDLLDAGWPATLPVPLAGAGNVHDIATLLALAVAAGSRGEQVWRDPFWRAFLRLSPEAGMAWLHDWLAGADPGPSDRVLAATLRSRAFTGAARLHLRLDGTRAAVWVEPGSACRLHAATAPAGMMEAAPLPFAVRLRLTRLLCQDMALLSASPVLAALPPEWRETFATLAQAALRRTAFRIPGAACCSLPYLFANVLNARGQARRSGAPPAQAWTLELCRPPLHVLLSLNGMARLRLHWPGQRSLALHGTE